MNKAYRFDGRSEEEFKRDIKNRTMQERSLFLRWIAHLERSTGTEPTYTDIGCGADGEFLEDADVSTEPDFEVEGFGKVEVKFAKPLLTRVFHLKVNQVKSYRENGAIILMINGADSDEPEYTMLTTESLAEIVNDCRVTRWQGFGGKPAYRIPVTKFIWRKLNA